MAQYDFRFLTEKQVATYKSDSTSFWFEVGKVLELPDVRSDEILMEVVLPYLTEHGLADNKFA
ncbi:hypothetical protein RIM91_34925, partial [Pseudomonas aeruginosa]